MFAALLQMGDKIQVNTANILLSRETHSSPEPGVNHQSAQSNLRICRTLTASAKCFPEGSLLWIFVVISHCMTFGMNELVQKLSIILLRTFAFDMADNQNVHPTHITPVPRS